jgi:hypothetical protein
MSFFEPPPPPEPEPPEQPQPPWIGPPGNELGVAVPIRYVLVRTDELAVLLDGFVAYSTGVELELTVKSRRKRHESREFHRLSEDVHFGFRFADGRKASNVGRHAWDQERSDPVLMSRGGHGGDGELNMRYWLWPLPPPGPLAFAIEWPSKRIEPSMREVDAGLIIEASKSSEVLWPDAGESAGSYHVTQFLHAASDEEPPEDEEPL